MVSKAGEQGDGMDEKDIVLGAEVVVRMRAKTLCTKQDLLDSGLSFDEMFREMVKEEGLFGICEDGFDILDVTPLEEK
jgi:hypothetical protein